MAEGNQGPFENSLPCDREAAGGFAEVLRQWRENHASPPSLLHHYTTADGLLGIVERSRLWATDVRFTNDPSEARYASGIISSAVEAARQGAVSNSVDPHETAEHPFERFLDPLPSFFNGLKSKLRDAYLTNLNDLTSGILDTFDRDFRVYMVCFCADGDSLSQWRGYGSKGGGYAVGFLADSLARRAESSHGQLLLRRVIYEPEEQRRIVNDGLRAFESMLAEYDRAIENARLNSVTNQPATDAIERLEGAGRHVSEEIQKLQSGSRIERQSQGLREFLLECLLCFKDRAFSAEAEWRLIQLTDSTPEVKFRVKDGQVAPYVELDLTFADGERQGRLPLESVRHGPKLDPEMTRKALDTLLRSRGYSNVEVRASGIPLR